MTTHRNIYMALAAAQSQMGPALKDATNPHFRSKYADLAAIVDAVRPALNENGICFFHEIERDGVDAVMVTVLRHGESDTSIRCAVPLIVGKNDMQGFKSATTYAKRIGLESVTGIAPDDDDGNAAAKSVNGKGHSSSEGLRDAWVDGIKDSLPEGYKSKDFANACVDQLIKDFAKYKTSSGLEGGYEKRKDIIGWIEEKFPDLYTSVTDAFMHEMSKFNEAAE